MVHSVTTKWFSTEALWCCERVLGCCERAVDKGGVSVGLTCCESPQQIDRFASADDFDALGIVNTQSASKRSRFRGS